MAGDICDVCGGVAVGVVSSALGAISFAYCQECLNRNAEPVCAFEATAWTCGHAVADWVKGLTTFMDGEYWTWDQWYTKHGLEVAKRLNESYDEYIRLDEFFNWWITG